MSTGSTSELVNNAPTLPFPELVLPPTIHRLELVPRHEVHYAIVGTPDKAAAAALYQQTLNDLVAGARTFEFECENTGYLDGYALETIKRLSYKIGEVRGTLSFTGCSEELAKLFEVARFTNLFAVRQRGAA